MLPACHNVYACVYSSVLSQSWNREDALRRRRERSREHRARETSEQREARLYQSRLRDTGNALILYYTLPSCHIDAKSINSLAFAALYT